MVKWCGCGCVRVVESVVVAVAVVVVSDGGGVIRRSKRELACNAAPQHLAIVMFCGYLSKQQEEAFRRDFLLQQVWGALTLQDMGARATRELCVCPQTMSTGSGRASACARAVCACTGLRQRAAEHAGHHRQHHA